MRRDDYCDECWDKIREEGYFSYWLTKRNPSGLEARLDKRARKARLLDLLVRLDHNSNIGEEAEPVDISDFIEDGKDDDLNKRRLKAIKRVRLNMVAHTLMHMQVLKWSGEKSIEGEKRKKLTFFCQTLNKDFIVDEISLGAPDIDQVKDEIDRFLYPPDKSPQKK